MYALTFSGLQDGLVAILFRFSDLFTRKVATGRDTIINKDSSMSDTVMMIAEESARMPVLLITTIRNKSLVEADNNNVVFKKGRRQIIDK